MACVLNARRVTKSFGGLTAVDSVSFDCEERSIVSLIGPNGAGKTTLFNCVTGFYVPEEGEISFEGRFITGWRPDQISNTGIARTYQNIRLFQNMTAIENVLVGQHGLLCAGMGGALLRLPVTRREERVAHDRARELLEYVGLKGLGDTLAKNLPYGDQRRLEIARALASKPRLLLLDEPTAGMNPRETEVVMNFIRELCAELGLTILLIEHDMKVVMGVSHRVIVLDHGIKIAEGAPNEVQNNARVIQAYLGTESETDGDA